MNEKKRSVGITVLGVLVIIHSLVCLSGIIIAPFVVGCILNLGALSFEIAVFISAVGLLRQKSWSRISTMVLVALYLVIELRGLIASARFAKVDLVHQELLVSQAIWIIFEIFIIWYLSSPKVKAQFK